MSFIQQPSRKTWAAFHSEQTLSPRAPARERQSAVTYTCPTGAGPYSSGHTVPCFVWLPTIEENSCLVGKGRELRSRAGHGHTLATPAPGRSERAVPSLRLA